MKTLEESAVIDYQNDRKQPEKYQIPDNCFIDWYKKGAKEAQRWISINETMPEDHQELLLDKKGKELEITKHVLVKYENGRYAIDCRRNAGDSYNFWKIEHSGIIEWRPIERS